MGMLNMLLHRQWLTTYTQFPPSGVVTINNQHKFRMRSANRYRIEIWGQTSTICSAHPVGSDFFLYNDVGILSTILIALYFREIYIRSNKLTKNKNIN